MHFFTRLMAMTRQQRDTSGEKGFALVYLVVTLAGLLLFVGLAVDTGRAYQVKAQLSKAVDGAALGAARMLNSGDPKAEAIRIFKANFPNGYLGTNSGDPTSAANFFNLQTDPKTGLNIVTVNASATLPTTFMRLGKLSEVTVASSGEATRRMVDLSLVLDASASIAGKWGAVRDAARTFIDAFDKNNDRVSLLTFGDGANVLDPMPSAHGFDKTKVMGDVPTNLPGGSTAMVEGLYRGWDELRSVANGQQSGLRVIVLFTDGASNSVPGVYPGSASARGLRTFDFPKHNPDPASQTWDTPQIAGLFDTQGGAQSNGFGVAYDYNSKTTNAGAPWLPLTSSHTHHRSTGIPTSFPLQLNTLTVNGVSQTAARGLQDWNAAQGRYPAYVKNINRAARNLVEIVANAARGDAAGDYPIRIYTIGMGDLVQ